MHYTNFHGLAADRFLRSMIAARGDRQGAAGHAISQGWDDGDMIAKAAVGGLESGGANGLHNYVSESFHAIGWPMSLFGKMTQTRPGSFSLTSLSQTGRSTGAWTGQSMAASMSVPVMSRLAPLPPYKCTALTVASLEAARDAAAEGQLAMDLARAVVLTADQGLVDGVDTDSATRPASIIFGAPSVSSSGDVAADVSAAICCICWQLDDGMLAHPPEHRCRRWTADRRRQAGLPGRRACRLAGPHERSLRTRQ